MVKKNNELKKEQRATTNKEKGLNKKDIAQESQQVHNKNLKGNYYNFIFFINYFNIFEKSIRIEYLFFCFKNADCK